jgi:hypothetical protein
MSDIINEPVEVIVSFKQNEIIPKVLIWRRKMYKIVRVHSVDISYNGSRAFYHFSVTDAIHYFRLSFNPYNLIWTLDRLYSQ